MLFGGAKLRKKTLGEGNVEYPKYDIQSIWVSRDTHVPFTPSREAVDYITYVLTQYENPEYPNTHVPKSPVSILVCLA